MDSHAIYEKIGPKAIKTEVLDESMELDKDILRKYPVLKKFQADLPKMHNKESVVQVFEKRKKKEKKEI